MGCIWHMHLNIFRLLMECSVLTKLYVLDLSMLEVSFMYIICLSGVERFLLSTQCWVFQYVIDLFNFGQGWEKGNVIILGWWEMPKNDLEREFRVSRLIVYPGKEWTSCAMLFCLLPNSAPLPWMVVFQQVRTSEAIWLNGWKKHLLNAFVGCSALTPSKGNTNYSSL